MTTIAVWRSKNEAHIASDSGVFDDSGLSFSTNEAKVWRAGNSLIGASGAFRAVEVVKALKSDDVRAIRDALVHTFRDGDNDSEVIVANAGGLFYIDSTFSIVQSREHYGATGSGAVPALVAMHALESTTTKPRDKVLLAVKAVATHVTTSARPPFKVISLQYR